MSSQDQIQAAEGVNSLQPELQAYLTEHTASINSIAQQLGIDPAALANAVAEEGDTVVHSVGSLGSVGLFYENIPDVVEDKLIINNPFLTSQSIESNYALRLNDIQSGKNLSHKTISDLETLVLNPTALDIGWGNLNLGVSILTLNNYLQKQPSDPLGLSQYGNNTLQFAKDIADPNSNTTFKVAGLIILQAQEFYASQYGSVYTNLSQADQSALLDTYFKQGETKILRQTLSDPTNVPNPNDGNGGAFSLENYDIEKAILSGKTAVDEPTFSDPTEDIQGASYDPVTGITTISMVSSQTGTWSATWSDVTGDLTTRISSETGIGYFSGDVVTGLNASSAGTLDIGLATSFNGAADASVNLKSTGEYQFDIGATTAFTSLAGSLVNASSSGVIFTDPSLNDNMLRTVSFGADNVLSIDFASLNSQGSVTGSPSSISLGQINPGALTANSNGSFTIDLTGGDILQVAANGSAVLDNSSNTQLDSFSSGQLGLIGASSSSLELGENTTYGDLGTFSNLYTVGSTGTLTYTGNEVFDAPLGSPNETFAQYQTAASALGSAVNTSYSVPMQTSVVDTQYISLISVGPLGSGFAGFAAGGDADLSDLGYASGNVVIGGPGIEVIMPDANDDGVFNNAATNVATDDLQPGQVRYMDASQNETYIVAQQSAASPATQAFYTMLADEANDQNRVADTDPLLIDLTGNGIQVSNWINNGVYFQSNVNGTAKDTSLHHTSWTESGTGMLVFDPSGGAITNINQTVSEYLNVSSNAAAVGSFTDGLAALASLSTSATVFSAATSKTDPNTGHSYWSEIEIATGLPSTSGAIPTAQLETLATALGTTGSISLTGSGNQGQSIAGSAVTNNATYTTAGGTTGAVAAVNLQIDTTGDITYNQANGSVVINSTPEGGASATTSYIDQASTAQSFVLSGGTLTDNGTTVTQQNGEAYNAVFAKAGDTVTVASGDSVIHAEWRKTVMHPAALYGAEKCLQTTGECAERAYEARNVIAHGGFHYLPAPTGVGER